MIISRQEAMQDIKIFLKSERKPFEAFAAEAMNKWLNMNEGEEPRGHLQFADIVADIAIIAEDIIVGAELEE